ncbi:MAG: YbaB/EbfC family nucleoid-associated protein [Dehalococcoidia bacterium]|nr:YbaB/EbfC family nucleoid-associated protein [Dehalococcoidia bacterium]
MNRQMRRAARRQQAKSTGRADAQTQPPMAMLQKMQDELETMTVEGSAGGGVVKVIMTGKQTVESVQIDPDAAEDVEMLQDLVTAAVNDALNKSQEMASEKLSLLTGGLDIPGLT